jgi:hypothetical protein
MYCMCVKRRNKDIGHESVFKNLFFTTQKESVFKKIKKLFKKYLKNLFFHATDGTMSIMKSSGTRSHYL